MLWAGQDEPKPAGIMTYDLYEESKVFILSTASCQYHIYKVYPIEIKKQGKYLLVYKPQFVFFRGINQGNLWFLFPVQEIITQHTCC